MVIFEMLKQKQLQQINKALLKGDIIALPTDTVYGLACDAFNLEAVRRISELKEREATKHYVIQVADKSKLQELIEPLTELQENIIEKYWPGEITFIFKKKKELKLPYLGDTIGIRIPNHAITKTILESYSNPLVVTSLNMSGEAPATKVSDISEEIKPMISVIVENSQESSNKASTVVDISKVTPIILRQGRTKFSLN